MHSIEIHKSCSYSRLIILLLLICLMLPSASHPSGGPTVRYGKIYTPHWGPISGAKLWSTMGEDWPTWSDEEGDYAVGYYIPPCPGFSFSYNGSIFAEMYYQNFNPKDDSHVGSYYARRPTVDHCFGFGERPIFTGTLGGLISQLNLMDLNPDIEPIYEIDFQIGIALVSGIAVLSNEARENIDLDAEIVGGIPLAENTEYAFAKPVFSKATPNKLDLDGDGQPDHTGLLPDGSVGVWLGESNPAEDLPDIIRQPDYDPDFADQGLLKTISMEDLENTDIYVYNVSSGELIASREGLNLEERGNGMNLIHFIMPLTGPDLAYIGIGEQIKIIAINRATGYIGTSVGAKHPEDAAHISFTPPPVIMRPPNLKIRAERKHRIEHGLTAGEDRYHMIGFEGSARTSDEYIAIYSEWYDWDGSPLPDDLPGYTGRLAKVLDENVLGQVGGRIDNFGISPGSMAQLIRLPQAEIDNSHYYIHVNGEPKTGNPGFSEADFATLGAGQGELEYRPKHYVPIKVGIYDEEETLRQKLDAGEPVEPDYRWVLRPEMQFSLFDLEVSQLERTDIDGNIVEILDAAAPSVSDTDQQIDLLYSLLSDEFPVLEPLGPGRELIFAAGGQEITADVGENNRLVFDNLDHLALLEPDDFLTLRLYQNSDDANILWEYQANVVAVERIYPSDADEIPISPGETAKLKAVTRPADRPVRWSIQAYDEGVEATIGTLSGLITAKDDTASGFIKVRATDKEIPGAYKEAMVYIGCQQCVADSVSCLLPGKAFMELSSIDVRISLGKAKGGKTAGDFFLRASEPSPELSTPKALEVSILAQEAEERYGRDHQIRQVRTPQTFVDILPVSDFKYDIKFYRPDAISGENYGLYEVEPAAKPVVTWRIENPAASPDLYNRLKVTESKNGDATVYEYEWDEGQNTWSLSRGNGLKVELRKEVIDIQTGNRIVTQTVRDESDKIASVVKTTYHDFPWGEEVIEEVQDPDGAALTTSTTYYDNPGSEGSYGNLKSQVNSDGSWVRYEYDSEGRTILRVRPWLDANAAAPASSAHAVYHDFSPVDPADSQEEEDHHRPRTVTEKILGKVVSRTYYAYKTNGAGGRTEIVERCLNPTAPYGDPSNERTVTEYYPVDDSFAESGRLNTVLFPDGRLDVYTYEYGTYEPDSNPALPGTFSPGPGNDRRETVTHGTAGSPWGLDYKTTREINIQSALGNNLQRETYVYTGNGFERIQWTVNAHDEFGRVVNVYNSDSTRTESNWGCCSKESETNAAGISTSYFYDDLQRLERSVQESLNSDIQTAYTYDAAGRRLTQTVSAGGLSLLTSNTYDTAGRLMSATDASRLVTDYDYDPSGLVTTVTRPGGATEVTTRYLDGRTKSITGTGVVPRFYEYGINADGTQWTNVYTGSENSSRWENSTVDMLGRTIRVEKPGFDGIEITENVYDEKGLLAKITTSGLADTLNVYDELGNMIRTGLDLDDSGSLEPASMDRISETEAFYTLLGGAWWQETRQAVYAKPDDGTATTTNTQRTRLTGLGGQGPIAETLSIDIHGNQIIQKVFLDRAGDTETRVIVYPDSETDAVAVMIRGLLVSATDKSGVAQTFNYDALGRRTGTTDPRTGTTVTHYNSTGQVDYIQDPAGNRSLYAYDPATGRRSTETNALGKVTRFRYNDRGQVTHTWGDATYPVRYVYETYGQLSEMHTYRIEQGWSSDSWPATAVGESDMTTWDYQESTGLLIAKEDAAGQRVRYTYTFGGKLDTRTWARTVGGDALVTTYVYDPNSAELTDIDYSDETPDVTFVYDRLGRQQSISDAVGNRTFAYNDSLQLESETITGLYDQVLTRTYETGAVNGRSTGFELGEDYSLTYGYDVTGRFNSVTWNVAGSFNTANYSYVENSNLLHQLTTGNGLRTTYEYEPNRDLRNQIKNEYGTDLISQYDYEYDELGRRTTVANSGQVFAAAAFNRFEYDDRNQLKESSRYQGSNVSDLSSPVLPEYRSYAYDPIGNRINATGWDEEAASPETANYTANPLNQYSQIVTDNSQQATDNLVYDFDGNLTEISSSTSTVRYRYNAENRLIAVEPQNPVDDDVKLEYTYDYIGRRVKKTVYTYESDLWSLTSDILFIYDGWNLVKEITADQGKPTTDKNYVWGLDLSQSLQGAGGVGGLLASVKGSSTHYFYYDGNGNVSQLVNVSDGSVAAHYEYDPFGNSIISNGPKAENNQYRFSTKYFDIETEHYYYGYRYYSAQLGRWLSRDPIEENGGINLYIFAVNSSINFIDNLGEDPWTPRDIREAMADIGQYLSNTIKNVLHSVSLNVLKHLKELSITAASKAMISGGYSFEVRSEWNSNKFDHLKYNMNFHVKARRIETSGVEVVGAGLKGECCSEVAIGGAGGGRFITPVPVVIGSAPVVGLSTGLNFYALVCDDGVEVPKFTIKELGGRYYFAVATGLRWGKEIKKFGVTAGAFFEAGYKGQYLFDFGTLKGELDHGFFGRAVAEIKFPGREKRRFQKSWNADDLSW